MSSDEKDEKKVDDIKHAPEQQLGGGEQATPAATPTEPKKESTSSEQQPQKPQQQQQQQQQQQHQQQQQQQQQQQPPPRSPDTALSSSSSLQFRRKEKPRMVHCDDCGVDVPEDEWPNHRARLREVVIQEQLTKFQRYIVSAIVDLFMWLLVNVFFREVAVCGLENVPKEGPVVFYGNHQNQFIDAMMIRAHCGRAVRFIIAEKSMQRPVIGHFARLMESVPVVRPQDVGSTVGQGKIIKTQRAKVFGEGTNFSSGNAIARGDVISWAVPDKKDRCSGQVLTIESDTELTLTLPVADEDVVQAPTSYKFSRRIDHSEMYASVYNTLSRGHCIGIFPEGGSHDRTSLQPLKAGVALFSLGAAERGIYPSIIPCGLTYFYGHKFRSRAHIEFGEPLSPSDEMIELFKNTEHKREATGELLKVLDKGLRNVTINVPDWASLKFLHAFRRLYQPPNVQLHTKDYLQLTRRLSIIINERDDDPTFADFRTKVENYNDYCAALLVRDSQAATLEKLDNASVQLLVRRLVLLYVMGIVLIPFAVVALPIGFITHFAAEAHAKTALSASSVKVVAADVKGSYKLVVGFITVPIVMNFVSLMVYFLSDARTALTVYFSLPMASYVSLLILQEFVLELRAALPLIMSIFSKHKQFRKLFDRRQVLVQKAKEMVALYDPTLDEELAQITVDQGEGEFRQPSLFSLRHSSRKPVDKKNR